MVMRIIHTSPTLQQDSEAFMEADLARSGLTPDDVRAVFMQPQHFVRHSEHLRALYKIPYYQWVGGKASVHPNMFRIRLDYNQTVRTTASSSSWDPSKPPRYTQPGTASIQFDASMPYMPPGGSGDVFLFCEGEKKLAACMKRFALPGVAMGGKDNWRDTRVQLNREHLLHPALIERLKSASRVLLISDGDVGRPHIGVSYRKLTRALDHAGLPWAHYNVGASVDDWLVDNPEASLTDLLEHGMDLFHADAGLTPDEFCEKYGLRASATGLPVPDMDNIALLLPQLDAQAVRLNEDTGKVEVFGRVATDGALLQVVRRVQGECFMGRCPKGIVLDAVDALAVQADAPYSPMRDWLDGLVWDGVTRLGMVFGEGEYERAAALSLLGGLVRRTYQPGSWHRQMVILTGPQGVGKTGFARWLVGDDEGLVYYGGAVSLSQYGAKDLVQAISHTKVVVFDDVDTFNRSENGTLKALVAASRDTFRAPYAHKEEEWPRKCVLMGTTNSDHFLPADLENTRYVPVRVPVRMDFEGLYTWRDQIFAEVVAVERGGGVIEVDMAVHKNAWESYEDEDPFEEQITEWMERTRTDKLGSIAFHDFEFDGRQYSIGVRLTNLASELGIRIGGPRSDSFGRVRAALQRLGFKYTGTDSGPRINGAQVKRLWILSA